MSAKTIRAIPLILVASTLVAAATASAGTISLRPSAPIERVRPLKLADIASLDGEAAEALAETVLVDDLASRLGDRSRISVGINDVRRALNDRGVNWGRLSLRGRDCVVRVVEPESESAPATGSNRTDREKTKVNGPTVRSRALDLLGRMFDVEAERLRASFRDSDAEFLSQAIGDRRVEVQPGGKASSSRIPIVVWIYQGQNLVESRTIRADVRVKRRVLMLANDVERDQRVEKSDLNPQTLWFSPAGSAPIASIEHAVGSVARRNLSAGTILRVSHLESPVIIDRGELVTVHCISGTVVVKGKARATSDARQGETVELRLGRDRERFTGRASAPGRVIVNLDHTSGGSSKSESAAKREGS